MHEIEEEFLDFLKYWKLQNNRMNKKDKLKCINSAGKQCKLAKKFETSASFGSQSQIVYVMVRSFFILFACMLLNKLLSFNNFMCLNMNIVVRY